MNTAKACINVNHIENNRWGPPLVDADWHAFAQAIYAGIEGSEWEELHDHHKEISKATGARKPSESQKSKGSLAMKAAKDKGEELFLEDWGLARVALSCHMTMDLLCQEMRDACWESSESMGYPCSLCSQCREAGCTRLGCVLSLPRSSSQ